jgi:hypothetical protein
MIHLNAPDEYLGLVEEPCLTGGGQPLMLGLITGIIDTVMAEGGLLTLQWLAMTVVLMLV